MMIFFSALMLVVDDASCLLMESSYGPFTWHYIQHKTKHVHAVRT